MLAGTYGRALELLLLTPAGARCGAAQLQPLGRLRLDEVCAGLSGAPGLAGSEMAAAAAAVTPVAESALLLPDGGGGGAGSSSGGMQARPGIKAGAAQAELGSWRMWGPPTGPYGGSHSDPYGGPETKTWP